MGPAIPAVKDEHLIYDIEGGTHSRNAFYYFQKIVTQNLRTIELNGAEELAYYALLAHHQRIREFDFRLTFSKDSPQYRTPDDLELNFMRREVRRLFSLKSAFIRPQPKISVCIPHHNRPESLAMVVDKLRNQSMMPYEVLIVDDGSRVDCRDKIKKLADVDWPFPLRFEFQSNQGARHARNTAARLATGDTLLFLDDDNYFLPHAIETFTKSYRHFDAEIFVAPFLRDFVENPDLSPIASPTSNRVWLPVGGALELAIFRNALGDMNGLFQRDFFLKIGGLDTRTSLSCEDWEFLIKALLRGGRIAVVPDILMVYRDSPNSFLKRAPKVTSSLSALRPLQDSFGIFSSLPFEFARERMLHD